MPSYVREGSLPHKRHIQFRRPDGGLYAEELFSTKGFESVYSLLYHLRPPTATLDVRAVGAPGACVRRRTSRCATGISRRARSTDAAATRSKSRTPLLGNDDIRHLDRRRDASRWSTSIATPAATSCSSSTAATGVSKRSSASSRIASTTISSIPTGTTYRVQPSTPTRMLVYETTGAVDDSAKYRNEFGQLEEHAPYYERDFRAPVLQGADRRAGRVRGPRHQRRAQRGLHRPESSLRRRRLGRILLSVRVQCRRVRADHRQAASAAAGARDLRSAGRRVLRVRAAALRLPSARVPVPYNHSSVDCDEVLYYVSGNFMSRRGVEEGSITLHAAGAPHGPQPGAVEQSSAKSRPTKSRSWSTRSGRSALPSRRRTAKIRSTSVRGSRRRQTSSHHRQRITACTAVTTAVGDSLASSVRHTKGSPFLRSPSMFSFRSVAFILYLMAGAFSLAACSGGVASPPPRSPSSINLTNQRWHYENQARRDLVQETAASIISSWDILERRRRTTATCSTGKNQAPAGHPRGKIYTRIQYRGFLHAMNGTGSIPGTDCQMNGFDQVPWRCGKERLSNKVPSVLVRGEKRDQALLGSGEAVRFGRPDVCVEH